MFSNSQRLFNVTIVCNKSNHSGLEHDVELLKKYLAAYATIKIADPLEHPVAQDINIHLEIPYYSHVPWGTYNVFVMNPEYYIKESYEPYMKHFDLVVTKEDLKYGILKMLDTLKEKTKIKYLPPILDRTNCPPISIVTLIYNRRKFFDLAKHNMILTDYPKDKIQWIIVDDSDNVEEQCSDKIIQTREQFTDMDIRYVPLLKKTPVSQKRNIGVENSTNDIVLFLDDDDHYPETSFRRRVAWLTKHPMNPKAVACTTIACYDLIKGVSAVNVPPFDLPLGQRISEATLTFYKSWYEDRKMETNIQVGEGESLINGRESDVLEIPPQQIIVAFSHSKNTSSRRIPATDGVEPSCFFGFPREYLIFIHELAGVKIVTS